MPGVDEEVLYEAQGLESSVYEAGDGDFTVAVVAENHGDEHGPREVFDEMFRDLPDAYEDLKLSYVPEANVFAAGDTVRKTPLEYQPNQADQHDLNRCYESARQELHGDEDLSKLGLTEQAAFHVLEYLEELQPDLVIDMHSGTSGTFKLPQARYKHREEYPVEEDDMRGIVRNAGIDTMASEPVEDAQMLGAVAPKMGFPAVTLEVGGGVKYGWEDAFSESEADTYRDVLVNMLDHALRGEETDFQPREFSGLQKRFIPMDFEEGTVEYHFPLGEEVLEGETVATVRTEEGAEQELEAGTDGALETVLTEDQRNEVKPGNRVFNLALRE
ncbi:MAG: succinylglutamate desuccinylase/aspartoacylase family protein [Candidatus Nanosalina sp.]